MTDFFTGCVTFVGGVGGSGTRVVAAFLNALGIHVGDCLNAPLDNLYWTLLFKRPELALASAEDIRQESLLFTNLMRGQRARKGQLDGLRQRVFSNRRESVDVLEWIFEQMASDAQCERQAPRRWAWKEPNSHIFAERFLDMSPSLKYVHVVRDGLDMAISANDNQMRTWGASEVSGALPQSREKLRFWCTHNSRVFDLASRMPERVLIVSFERLCKDPYPILSQICHFIDDSTHARYVSDLASQLVTQPATIGRGSRLTDLDICPEDRAYAHYVSDCLGKQITPDLYPNV